MQEKNWPKIVLGVILGIIVFGGLIFLGYSMKKKGVRLEVVKGPATPPSNEIVVTPTLTPTPTAAVIPTTSPTAGWETYTNIKSGYLFKHPLGWVFKATVIGDESKPLYVIRESLTSNDIDNYLVQIKTWNNPSGLKLLDWIQFMRDSNALGLPAEDVVPTANFQVAEEPAFKIWSDPISKGQEPGKCFQACPILSVYFTHGSKAYSVEQIYMREVDGISQQLFKQVLSTFQFLE